MSIEKLKRVMWRIRSRYPGRKRIKRDELLRVIMIECGTSPQTYYNNMWALIKMGWLTKYKRQFMLTDKDIVEDF